MGSGMHLCCETVVVEPVLVEETVLPEDGDFIRRVYGHSVLNSVAQVYQFHFYCSIPKGSLSRSLFQTYSMAVLIFEAASGDITSETNPRAMSIPAVTPEEV